MRRAWGLVLAALLVLPATNAFAKSARSDDPDFEWSVKLARGQSIEIHGVNGSIQASPARGNEVEVTAVKRAKRSDPRDVKIEVIEHENGVTICAVYPGAGNSCEQGSSHSHTRNNDVVVDFQVRVPAGVKLIANTVNGEVEAEHLDGPVEAHTVNGSVSVSTDDTALASTVNGSVSARVGSSNWDEELKFSTVNGGITVRFPEDLNADVDASTLNGNIETDFPLTVRGKMGRHHISGKIGHGGGGELSLSTVNGSIRLISTED
jgi:hypothetical protein